MTDVILPLDQRCARCCGRLGVRRVTVSARSGTSTRLARDGQRHPCCRCGVRSSTRRLIGRVSRAAGTAAIDVPATSHADAGRCRSPRNVVAAVEQHVEPFGARVGHVGDAVAPPDRVRGVVEHSASVTARAADGDGARHGHDVASDPRRALLGLATPAPASRAPTRSSWSSGCRPDDADGQGAGVVGERRGSDDASFIRPVRGGRVGPAVRAGWPCRSPRRCPCRRRRQVLAVDVQVEVVAGPVPRPHRRSRRQVVVVGRRSRTRIGHCLDPRAALPGAGGLDEVGWPAVRALDRSDVGVGAGQGHGSSTSAGPGYSVGIGTVLGRGGVVSRPTGGVGGVAESGLGRAWEWRRRRRPCRRERRRLARARPR